VHFTQAEDIWLKSSIGAGNSTLAISGRHPQFSKNFAGNKLILKVSFTNAWASMTLEGEDYRLKMSINV